jgi:predicted TIM-barrel fold metal-dependent hydrolase
LEETASQPKRALKVNRPDREWLGRRREEIVEPRLPIIDSHHHVWVQEGWRYLFDELLADAQAGHNIIATVATDSHTMYRADGPEEFRCVGETEFVNGLAAQSASGLYGPSRLCRGIVGHAPLRIGARVREVLEAHIRAGGERFKGVRFVANYDEDPEALGTPSATVPPHLYADPTFREGFKALVDLGLTFDATLLHPQLPDVVSLARAFPEAKIALNHLGKPGALGRFAGKREEVFRDWRRNLEEVADCPNVVVKIGGLGIRTWGWKFHEQETPPSSDELAQVWGPYVDTVIQTIGPRRCMMESNCPPDLFSAPYVVIWNAYKKIAAGYTPEEKLQIFKGTANEFYSLKIQ